MWAHRMQMISPLFLPVVLKIAVRSARHSRFRDVVRGPIQVVHVFSRAMLELELFLLEVGYLLKIPEDEMNLK